MEAKDLSATILVVDDTIENQIILEDVLTEHYQVITAKDGEDGLSVVEQQKVDLVILDVLMPKMNGFELCRAIRKQSRFEHLPVLFVSSLESAADESYALSLGGNDFIHKPISSPVVLARVHTHLQLAKANKRLEQQNQHLQEVVDIRTREIITQSERLLNANRQVSSAQAATISALCSLAEVRDSETGNHIIRTQNYVKTLSQYLASHERFKAFLTPETIEELYQCAPLHDIGKVAIPDRILLKPGKLNDTEWEVMKRHTEFGYKAITSAAKHMVKGDSPFLRHAAEIAYCHHEKWDGSGYPQGLSGDDIPIAARLMAVADVYDALISKRVYKSAYSHKEAIEIITRGRGSHFDPDMVDALLAVQNDFAAIAVRYADE